METQFKETLNKTEEQKIKKKEKRKERGGGGRNGFFFTISAHIVLINLYTWNNKAKI